MKARIKDYSNMPEYVSCCRSALVAMLPTCGRIIEVQPSSSTVPIKCPLCGTIYPIVPTFALVGMPNARIPADCVDIDEGEEN